MKPWRLPSPGGAAVIRILVAAPAALLFGAPLAAVWRADVPAALGVAAAAILLMGAAAPVHGLMVVAVLSALATPIGAFLGAPFGGAQTIEALVLPLLAGACLRAVVVRNHGPSRLLGPALVTAAVVAASAATDLAAWQHVTAFADEFVADLWRHVTRGYFLDASRYPPLHHAMVWLEALALAVVVERELLAAPGTRTRLAVAVVGGGAAAAVFTAGRVVEVALRATDPLATAGRLLASLRTSVHIGDLNAAGSYWVLMLVPAAWWLATTRARWLMAAVPVLTLALWMTGSRSALAALVVGLAAAWVFAKRPARTTVAAGAAVALLLIAGMVTWNAGRSHVRAGRALEIRLELAKVALELATYQPVFGLGLGGFRPASAGLVSPRLVEIFPASAQGENAHNNFLQVLVELGLAGFGAFVWLLGALLGAVLRDRVRSPIDSRLAGLVGGLVAFLATCLAGHPLLVPQVLLPFGLMVGLTAGLMAPPARTPRRVTAAGLGLALAGVLLLSAPARVVSWRRAANLDGTVIGTVRMPDEGGERVDLIETRGRWFVAGAGRMIELQARPAAESGPCRLDLGIDGATADQARLAAGAWQRIAVAIPAQTGRRGSRRLDLRPVDAGCAVLVQGVRVRP